MQENKASFVAQESLLQEREETLTRYTSTVSSLQVGLQLLEGQVSPCQAGYPSHSSSTDIKADR